MYLLVAAHDELGQAGIQRAQVDEQFEHGTAKSSRLTSYFQIWCNE